MPNAVTPSRLADYTSGDMMLIIHFSLACQIIICSQAAVIFVHRIFRTFLRNLLNLLPEWAELFNSE